MSKFSIIKGSCIDQEVDCIVNAANKYLICGGGVCGAIYDAAGYNELKEACSKYQTPLKDGDAVITSAFNIKNTQYIIHAVGPDFALTPNSFLALYNAYYHSLELLKSYQLHKIAFPLISAGIFGGNLEDPVGTTAKEALKAYHDFCTNHPNYNIEVLLCCYSEEEYKKCQSSINI